MPRSAIVATPPAAESDVTRDVAHGEKWTLFLGDNCDVLKEIPDHTVHLAHFSPPFALVYSYSPSERDMGNCRTNEEFFEHHAFFRNELLRVMVPGRVVAVHIYEIQEYTTKSGSRGRYDFPGDYIRHMEAGGFRWIGRITIGKNPQTQAIRNHPQELLFAQLNRDASKLCVAQADYVLIFRAPGENPVPIHPDVDEDEWIKLASPVWDDQYGNGIREMDILPDAGSKENDDERHLCALQLPVIARVVRLWSNPGETVLDPFAGIGSVPYQSVLLGRHGLGIELKRSYWEVACRFLAQAESKTKQRDLFSVLAEQEEQEAALLAGEESAVLEEQEAASA